MGMGFKDEINLQERAIGVMTTDVFISYSSAYRKLVDALVHYLEESKIKCWYAPRDIPPGMEYAEAIDLAINNSKFFIILVSDLSQKSHWCRSEVNLAVAYGKIIIPVRIEDVELNGAMKLYLNDRHWIEAFPEPELNFEGIRDAVWHFTSRSEVDVCDEKLGYIEIDKKIAYYVKELLSSVLFFYALWMGIILIVTNNNIKLLLSSICIASLIIGIFLSREHPLSKIKLVPPSQQQVKNALIMFMSKFFGAWILLMGIMCSLVFMGMFLEKNADPRNYFLYWIGFSGASLAMLKTGWALIFRRWSKFSFTAKRFFKWILIIGVPFFSVAIIGAYFNFF